jgi:hypothetical protein
VAQAGSFAAFAQRSSPGWQSMSPRPRPNKKFACPMTELRFGVPMLGSPYHLEVAEQLPVP